MGESAADNEKKRISLVRKPNSNILRHLLLLFVL